MLKTFNCGIGMVLVINSRVIDNVLSLLKNEDIDAFQIGEITDSGKLEYHGLTA
jgi:phosphoribosylaminoimidazole (AIR) synthetase